MTDVADDQSPKSQKVIGDKRGLSAFCLIILFFCCYVRINHKTSLNNNRAAKPWPLSSQNYSKAALVQKFVLNKSVGNES